MQPCPACGAERGHFYDCPTQRSEANSEPEQSEANSEPERSARRRALPLTLAVMLLLAFTPLRFAQSLFFGMWLHELGHAVAAWLTGAFALPLPWVTLGGHERSGVFIALELSALATWVKLKPGHWRAAATVGAVLLVGVLLPRAKADVVVLFFGDGGALVFGALLMAAVFLPDDARLARGGLRWGFLVIGAGAFASVYATWLSALRDRDEVPFGRIEGVGLSDPSRLVDVHGWSVGGLVHAYVALGVVCLGALAAGWWWHGRGSRREGVS